jgi:hypothetical protein
LSFIAVFLTFFDGDFMNNPSDYLLKNLTSKDFINNQFATTISLSISAALIPPIVYVGYRTILLQRKNRSYWNFDTINIKQSSITSTVSKKQIKANRYIRKGSLLLDRGLNDEAIKEFDKALT